MARGPVTYGHARPDVKGAAGCGARLSRRAMPLMTKPDPLRHVVSTGAPQGDKDHAKTTTSGRVTALVVLGCGVSGPAAFAATEGGDAGTSLSEQEEPALQIAFNEFDEDQDGSLNWRNRVLPAHNGWFSDFDVDGNQDIG